ncbi:MAG: helix-turn-helix transcriptional regulator [Firmicutes bacterium]|uniref:Helix-turn-helix transcriptional regulator n=1 Tax=Candidatus Onthovivens merdipullorum TaxID=2840889 RepID=A0A9D9DLH6_9BACL|nr:helix-turn-helix transcriptional regulator [Candidatus Onthovivens merdipullorum]
MKLNEKLIKLRKSKGLSQDEFAEKISVSRQAVSKWELGDSEPELNKIKSICDYYGIDYNYLIDDNETLTSAEKNLEFKKINFLPLYIGLFIGSIIIFIAMLLLSGFLPYICKISYEPDFIGFLLGSYDQITFIIYKIIGVLFLASSITFGVLTFKKLIKQGYIKKKDKKIKVKK